MSTNTVVNEKFTKNCTKHYSILNDADRVKKKQEDERRIMRLKQVREESKNLARQIRNDVAAEKEKQLQNLEAIKTQELNCWRHHALSKKHHDYRSAIFEVGAAHCAAYKEASKKDNLTKSYKDFRKQAYARRSLKTCENKENRDLRSKINLNVSTQTSPTQKIEKKKREGCKLCRRHVCFCGLDISETDDNNSIEFSNNSNISSVLSPCSKLNAKDKNKCTQTSIKGSILQKTPIVIDVEVGSCDNTSVSDFDVDDIHVQDNRKFSRVIRPSPKKNYVTKIVKSKAEKSSNSSEKTDDTKTVKTSLSKASTTSSISNTTKSSNDPISISTVAKNIQKTEKRFTKISDLLNKNNNDTESNKNKPGTDMQCFSIPPSSPTKSVQLPLDFNMINNQEQLVSSVQQKISIKDKKNNRMESKIFPKNRKTGSSIEVLKKTSEQNTTVLPKSKYKLKDSYTPLSTQAMNSAKSIKAISKPNKTSSTAENISIGCDGKSIHTACAEKVQFYDYNNRFGKKYEQPPNAVQHNVGNNIQLNAVELAKIEREKQLQNLAENAKTREASIQRGEEAYEREQIRRECNELTEKLDALMKQYPKIVARDADFVAGHRYTDVTARKETQMNAKIEEMLLKPTAITCPVVKPDNKLQFSSSTTTLNMGDHSNHNIRLDKNFSSDSCCSILLNYVNEQGKEIQKDLSGNLHDPLKEEKLRKLLHRVEELRKELLQEIKEQTPSGNKNGRQVKNIIDSISAVCNERDEISKKEDTKPFKSKKLIQHEKEIKQNEKPILSSPTSTKKSMEIVETSNKNPVEIIIKIPGCSNSVNLIEKIESKTKVNIKDNKPKSVENVEHLPEKSRQIQSQNSYDSNSTAYQNLPNELASDERDILNKLFQSQINIVKKDEVISNAQSKQINALVAHYVQRLLGMSRKSVKELGVSSSNIETPHSSIINIEENQPRTDESLISNDKLKQVEELIIKNRCFFNDLEQSLLSQMNQSVVSSASNEIWKNRFEKKSEQQKIKNFTKKNSKTKVPANKTSFKVQRTKKKSKDCNLKTSRSVHSHELPNIISKKSKNKTKPINDENVKQQQLVSSSPRAAISQPIVISTSEATEKATKEVHIERYAELTDNCTQRIKELTELINKVRLEKRKLLEVTLSSASGETVRNSTEYLDLPETQKTEHVSLQTDPSLSSISNNYCCSSSNTSDDLCNELPKTAVPLLSTVLKESKLLSKHNQIGASVDSGISMSRPVTAQDQHLEQDPTSLNSQSSKLYQQRKQKPPVALKRFSPQMIDGDLVHELSTITEVETPATSRVNFSNVTQNQKQNELQNEKGQNDLQIIGKCTNNVPFVFPTFEEYIKEMHSNLTYLDDEQSFLLHKEYNNLISMLKDARTKNEFIYTEFPTMASYLEDLMHTEQSKGSQKIAFENDKIDFLFSDVRTNNINIKLFPSSREYMEHRKTNNSPEAPLIDTESLENISENATSFPTPSDGLSGSLNIEEELRKRNILQSSFRRIQCKENKQFAESTRNDNDETLKIYKHLFAIESGIEKLSTSNSLPSSIERKKQILGINKVSKRQNSNQHSSSSETFPTPELNEKSSNCSKRCVNTPNNEEFPSNLNDLGRPLNLREFITRELLKHANSTVSSTSSADDSLRYLFLKSIIDSLSPNGNAGTGLTLDRQKTSTPVVSSQSPSLKSATTSSQLFSGESLLSSVHCQDEASILYYRKDEKKMPK